MDEPTQQILSLWLLQARKQAKQAAFSLAVPKLNLAPLLSRSTPLQPGDGTTKPSRGGLLPPLQQLKPVRLDISSDDSDDQHETKNKAPRGRLVSISSDSQDDSGRHGCACLTISASRCLTCACCCCSDADEGRGNAGQLDEIAS